MTIQAGDLVTRKGCSVTGRVIWTQEIKGVTFARVHWSRTLTGGKVRRGMAPLIQVSRLEKVDEG